MYMFTMRDVLPRSLVVFQSDVAVDVRRTRDEGSESSLDPDSPPYNPHSQKGVCEREEG